MWYIPILFQVSGVEINFIAYFNTFNIIRCQVRTDKRQVNMHFVAFAENFSFTFSLGYVRVLIIFDFEEFNRFIADSAGRYTLCIVWLANSRMIKDQLHLIPTDIKYLRTLRQLRSCW